MTKKYFCDYCGTRFAYSAEAWRRHVRGTAHLAARALHYRQVSSAAHRLAAERTRPVCRQHRQAAGCPFGEACTFSHLSNADIRRLEEVVAAQEPRPPTLDTWLRCHPQMMERDDSRTTYTWQPPPAVRQLVDATPSLVAVNVTLHSDAVEEWG